LLVHKHDYIIFLLLPCAKISRRLHPDFMFAQAYEKLTNWIRGINDYGIIGALWCIFQEGNSCLLHGQKQTSSAKRSFKFEFGIK
jgi:hypothetical protein